MNKKILAALLGMALAGCSVEGKNDYGSYYQKQASLDVLKMPPGVSAQGADNYYVVPPGPMADVKTVSILPPGSRAYKSAMAKESDKAVPAITPAPGDSTAANDTTKAVPAITPAPVDSTAANDTTKAVSAVTPAPVDSTAADNTTTADKQ